MRRAKPGGRRKPKFKWRRRQPGISRGYGRARRQIWGGVAPYKPPHSIAEETTVSVRELASEPTLQNVKDLLAEVEVQIAFGDLKVARLLVSKGLGMAPSSPPLMAALQRIDGLSHTDDDDWMGGRTKAY